MVFRRRNVDISSANASAAPQALERRVVEATGTRPSAVDGRPTTSTGTPSLDALLARHGGLALGTSLLIEENGNTDYGGALLKFFAAEGVLQGHVVHVVGTAESWTRTLPGVAEYTSDDEASQIKRSPQAKQEESENSKERMRIAWRYERLGEFRVAGSRAIPPLASDSTSAPTASGIFCHAYDLAKKLSVPAIANIRHHTVAFPNDQQPFVRILLAISKELKSTAEQGLVHRLVIPTLLSPAFYPSHACEPQSVLQFFHQLRSLCSQFPQTLTVMATLPLDLHPRSSGLVRWLEALSDGVLELTPFPHASDEVTALSTSGAATADEEQPQGMVKIHKLPIFHERCGGGGGLKGLADNLAFTVSRRRFAIRTFSLPPAHGDVEAQSTESGSGPRGSKDGMDF